MTEFTMKELFPLIEEGIKNGGQYRFYPRGVSMLPLIRQGVDSVVLCAVSDIKKYDIILYTRDDGTFVLHRVVGLRDGKYDLCGDNQCFVEKGIRLDQVKAIVSGLYRDDNYVSKDDPQYTKYVINRVKTIPIRRLKARIKSLILKIRR